MRTPYRDMELTPPKKVKRVWRVKGFNEDFSLVVLNLLCAVLLYATYRHVWAITAHIFSVGLYGTRWARRCVRRVPVEVEERLAVRLPVMAFVLVCLTLVLGAKYFKKEKR